MRHLWQINYQINHVECHTVVFPQRYVQYTYGNYQSTKINIVCSHEAELRTMLHVQIGHEALVKAVHVLLPQNKKIVEAFVVGRPALSLLSSFSKFMTCQYLEEIN